MATTVRPGHAAGQQGSPDQTGKCASPCCWFYRDSRKVVIVTGHYTHTAGPRPPHDTGGSRRCRQPLTAPEPAPAPPPTSGAPSACSSPPSGAPHGTYRKRTRYAPTTSASPATPTTAS